MKKRMFVLIMIVVTIGATAGGYALWRSKTQTPQALFESGKKYFDQKKYREAMIQFMNAVRKNPRHRDARFYLARALAASGDVGAAMRQLNALLEYYPNDAVVNLELGNVYLAFGRSNPDYIHQAQDRAQKVLAQDPKNVDALILSGAASAGLQDYSGSVDTLEKAISLDPKNARAFISLGATQALQKDLPDAEKSFVAARNANPKDKGAVLSLANYYRMTNAPEKAEAALKDALALNPGDRQTYVFATDFYSRAGRVNDVEKVLQNAQAATKDDPTPSLTLVSYYDTLNRPADARKLLLDLKTKFPKNIAVATNLATNLMRDQTDKARAEIDQIIKLEPKNPMGYALLGEAQYQAGEIDAAEATLSKDPPVNAPYPQVQFILGNIAVRKGQADQGINHLQKSLQINKAYLPARIALAEVLFNKGQVADARLEVEKVLQAAPKNQPVRLLKSNIDIVDKNYAEAERGLLALVQEQPDNAVFQRQLGVYYAGRGKTAEAEKSLSRAIELSRGSEQPFRDLVGLYLNAKQTDRAFQKINSVPDAQKQPFHYELLGLAYLASGKRQDAESTFKKALEKDPNRAGTSELLFQTYMQDKRFDDAKGMLDERLRKNASNSGVLALRGSVYEVQGKLDDARKDYTQALQLDPNQPLASNNLAYLLANEGRDLDTALKYAQNVRNQHPNDPNVADTLGWVYYKLGRAVLARDSVQFATSKQPDNPLFQFHLGMIYKANNQRSEAESALKKAVSTRQDFKERTEAEAALQDIDHWRHLVNSGSAK
jgi:tetratricopeptide (TPR) repeat protein